MSGSRDITISVTDPTKCTDKFGQVYISYNVNTSTNRSGFTPGPTTVVRRYNDFAWLSATISRECPGVIVPPLPDKQSVGRFSSEFVESRRRSLEKFLQRASVHPEIGTLAHFVSFLQADESTLSRAKNESKATKPGMMAWFEGTVSTLGAGKTEIEKSAADTKIEEISQYIAALEKQMVNVTKHSEGLVKRSREMAHAIREFGQSTTWLGQSEGDSVGGALTQLGSTADTLADTTSTHAEAEAIKLLEPLEEYARMLSSIRAAMQQRQDKKTAYVSAMADVESKSSSYKKLLGVPGKESQAAAKEAAVNAAQENANEMKTEFEKVSERLLSEFEMFKNQKAVDIKEIILNFINLQIDYHKAADDAWSALLPKVEEIVIMKSQMDSQHASSFRTLEGEEGPSSTSVTSGNGSGFQEQDVDEEDMVGV